MSDPVRDVEHWWAEHPMTYGEVHGESNAEIGSPQFFADWHDPRVRSGACKSPMCLQDGRATTITMKRTRHTPEQVIRKLREADGMLSAVLNQPVRA